MTNSDVDHQISELSKKAGAWLLEHDHQLVTVESCTGGGVATAITDIAGSSSWFERGFVTYSNLAKQELVDVPTSLIEKYGAVSEQVAAAMAQGGLNNSAATISLSVTGIAGPDGGSAEKPIGMVCFGKAQGDRVLTITQLFKGDRKAIRKASIFYVLAELLFKNNS